MGELHYQGKRLAEELPAEPGGGKGRRVETDSKGFWSSYGPLMIMAACIVLLLKVVFQLAFVPTASMEDTIPTNSLLISWQLPYVIADPSPKHGDVVTFWSEEENKLLVKRVIGLGGDEIDISGGYVYRNDELLEEPYLREPGGTSAHSTSVYQVPEGHMFMMGDNRRNSLDSRLWKDPYAPVEAVNAKVLLCIPLKKAAGWMIGGRELTLYLPLLGQIHAIA